MTALQMFIELSELIFALNKREDRNAFIEFSGHVDEISVRVHTNGSYALGDDGTEAFRKVLIDTYFYFDRENTFTEFIRIMEELENELL